MQPKWLLWLIVFLDPEMHCKAVFCKYIYSVSPWAHQFHCIPLFRSHIHIRLFPNLQHLHEKTFTRIMLSNLAVGALTNNKLYTWWITQSIFTGYSFSACILSFSTINFFAIIAFFAFISKRTAPALKCFVFSGS